MLILTAPAILPHDTDVSATLSGSPIQADEAGTHFLYDLGNGDTLQVLRLADVGTDEPLAALVPLDADGPDRLAAINRLLRALLGRRVPHDKRLITQERHRHRVMLQAIDGRMNGASYRDIANVLFGADRVAGEPWKTSSLRYATMGLIKDAFAMIGGGYRTLLHLRHKP